LCFLDYVFSVYNLVQLQQETYTISLNVGKTIGCQMAGSVSSISSIQVLVKQDKKLASLNVTDKLKMVTFTVLPNTNDKMHGGSKWFNNSSDQILRTKGTEDCIT
jgi:hypothetical protein